MFGCVHLSWGWTLGGQWAFSQEYFLVLDIVHFDNLRNCRAGCFFCRNWDLAVGITILNTCRWHFLFVTFLIVSSAVDTLFIFRILMRQGNFDILIITFLDFSPGNFLQSFMFCHKQKIITDRKYLCTEWRGTIVGDQFVWQNINILPSTVEGVAEPFARVTQDSALMESVLIAL